MKKWESLNHRQAPAGARHSKPPLNEVREGQRDEVRAILAQAQTRSESRNPRAAIGESSESAAATVIQRQPSPQSETPAYSPLEIVAARMTLAAMKAPMDEYALEIFELWVEGKSTEVVFDNEKWKKYLMAEESLQKQIAAALAEDAQSMVPLLKKVSGPVVKPYYRQFHAVVGQEEAGGYFRGYDLLHGTNSTQGDFEIFGRVNLREAAVPAGGCIVIYDKLQFVFNDVADVNKNFAPDIPAARTVRNCCKILGIGPPRDYTLRIKWNADYPISAMFGPHGEFLGIQSQIPMAKESGE